MQAPLISVIIPVYNVEKYLNQCVESVVNQTYKNLEIILVDDGSPDHCPQMCDDWAQKDARIKVIHKENGGLSDARNAGLDVFNGCYVYFIDSDDYIEDDAIEILYSTLIKFGADLAVGAHRRVNEDGVCVFDGQDYFSSDIFLFTPEEYWIEFFEDSVMKKNSKLCSEFVISCNKLYNKQLFNHVKFPVGKLHEDEYTTYQLVFNSKKIVYIDRPLYNYVQRNDSIMGLRQSKFSKENLAIEALEQRNNFIQQSPNRKLREYSHIYLMDNLIWDYTVILHYVKDRHELRDIKRKYNYLYLHLKSICSKNNAMYLAKKNEFFVFYISPFLFRVIRKVRHIFHRIVSKKGLKQGV